MAQDRAKQLLQQGIAAAKAGQNDQARQMLQQAVRLDPQNETTWLWLSSVARDDKERIFCLRQLLEINPQNELARKGLRQLGVEPAAAQEPASGVPVVPAQKLSSLQDKIDDFLRTYSPTPRSVLEVEWVQKTRGRYGEGRATRLRRTMYASAAIVGLILLVGAALLVSSIDVELPFGPDVVVRPTLTASPTSTSTATPTPGIPNTPTPRPAITDTPIPVPEDLPVGNPFISTPTPIYPRFDPAVAFQMRQVAEAYTVGDYETVSEISNQLREEQFRNCYPETYYYEALALSQQGDYQDAAQLLEDGLTREIAGSGTNCEGSALLLTGLCQVRYAQALAGPNVNTNLLDQAVNHCQAAITEDSLLLNAQNTLAEVYISLGRAGQSSALNLAASVLANALNDDPDSVELLLTRAELDLVGGQPHDALLYIESALQVDPANAEGLLMRTDAYLQIARNASPDQRIRRFGEVAINAERYLLFYPGDPRGHLLLATARYNEGNADRALESLTRILQVVDDLPDSARPTVVEAYGLRVQIYLERQNWSAALDDLERLRALDPNNLQWIEQQARVALELGDYDDALEAVQAGLNILPSPELILTQARLLAQTCQFEVDLDCDPDTVLSTLTDDFIATLAGERQGDALLYRAQAELAALTALAENEDDEDDLTDAEREEELEAILQQVNEAIVLHQTPEAYFTLGTVLEALERPREALRAYEWVAYWTQFYQYPFGGRAERVIQQLIEDLEDVES